METVLTDEIECGCGVCRPCRVAMKEYDKLLGDDYLTLTYKAGTINLDGPKKESRPTASFMVGTFASQAEKRAARDKARREERFAERVMVDGNLVHPEAKHGTIGGYTNFGCRCEPCRGRMSELKKKSRERNKSNAVA